MSTKTANHPNQHHMGQRSVANTGERHSENTAPADTMDGHDERFRLLQVCAYGLWEQAGKPNDDGSRERFWLEAEKTITGPCCKDG